MDCSRCATELAYARLNFVLCVVIPYEGTVGDIQYHCSTTETFDNRLELKQGCVLAPTLCSDSSTFPVTHTFGNLRLNTFTVGRIRRQTVQCCYPQGRDQAVGGRLGPAVIGWQCRVTPNRTCSLKALWTASLRLAWTSNFAISLKKTNVMKGCSLSTCVHGVC